MKNKIPKALIFGCLALFLGINARAEEIPKQATLYYDNSVTKWESVYVYIWGPKEHFLPWGSTSMKMNRENDICSYTLSLDDRDAYSHFIFWDGGSRQTKDLPYTGEQRIFRGVFQSSNKWDGSWYVMDDGRLLEQKLAFDAIAREWYTADSYEKLRLTVSLIPDVYDDAYLLINEGVSQYETDYSNLITAYEGLQYSAATLVSKITELEGKNMTGYTYESVLAFRSEVEEVKSFVDKNVFTQETLKSNYDKLNQSAKLLVLTKESGTNVVIEEMKNEIDKLRDSLKNGGSDTEEIMKICKELESAYRTLTGQSSKLSDIVDRMLKTSAGNGGASELREQLDEELNKLSALLTPDTTRIDDLIAGYEELENNYRELVESGGAEPAPEIPRVESGDGKYDALIYVNTAANVAEVLLLAFIAFFIIKRRNF